MLKLKYKTKYRIFTDEIPEWYYRGITLEEVIHKFSSKEEAYEFLNMHNLLSPQNKIKKLPIWYDKNKTEKEMADIAKISYHTVRKVIAYFSLPHKDSRIGATHRRKIPSAPEWYDPNLSITEMAAKSGRTYAAIHMQLCRLAKRGLDLTYKRKPHDQVVKEFIQASEANQRRISERYNAEINRTKQNRAG